MGTNLTPDSRDEIPSSKLIEPKTGEVQRIQLTQEEAEELKTCESVIHKGWGTFLQVAEALVIIRDKKLYKEKYDHFPEYWRRELGISRSYAYNLIGSADVSRQLSSIEDFPTKELTEAQLRELISVPTEKRADAWKNAVKLAGEKPITAKIVREASEPFKIKKRKAKKSARGKTIDLEPVLNLLSKLEGLAETNDDKIILNELMALRKLLEELK